MTHIEWLRAKKQSRAVRFVHKPWCVYNYVHCKPYEVCRYAIRADAENHKQTLARFLPGACVVVVFEPPGEEYMQKLELQNIASPDPSWDYEPVWEKLQRIIFESKHLKKILADQESATDQGDAAIAGWLAKVQGLLDEVGIAMGDSPTQLDEG